MNEVNSIVESDIASREADANGEVSAQGGGDDANMTLTERVKRWIRPLSNDTAVEGPRGVDTARATHFTSLGKNTSTDGAADYDEYEDAGGEARASDYVDYDYEPLGAVSGTYAVAVSLIFLEQIALNGGSITVI